MIACHCGDYVSSLFDLIFFILSHDMSVTIFITARRSGCCIVFGVSVCLASKNHWFHVHWAFGPLWCILSEIMNVCLSVRMSVRGFGPFNGLFWLTITFRHCVGMLGNMWTNLCHYPYPAVPVRGRTDTFLDGLGCLFGAFCPPPTRGQRAVRSSLELILVSFFN